MLRNHINHNHINYFVMMKNTPLIEMYEKYNIKGTKDRNPSRVWFMFLISLMVMFFFIISILWLTTKARADQSVTIGGYVEATRYNTKMCIVEFQDKLLFIPEF